MIDNLPHISVCVCTYKRPHLLVRILGELATQETGGLFTHSIVIADNDGLQSAKAPVEDFTARSPVAVKYCLEPRQSIALARNKVVENAEGDFLAFIDDDERPGDQWLLTLFRACNAPGVDGVLGPVQRRFEVEPPKWVMDGLFYERPVFPTGSVVKWRDARSGNVLVKKHVFPSDEKPFRPEFRGGEDRDFFRRMIEKGFVFIWCDEAVSYEIVPPTRWKRTVLLRRALLRGAVTLFDPNFGVREIVKSAIAVPVYALALPFSLLLGQHKFMDLMVRLCDHLGKLLAVVGLNPVKEPYVTE
ncbi:MAG: glycosyltransferase [Terriglobales bacterium]